MSGNWLGGAQGVLQLRDDVRLEEFPDVDHVVDAARPVLRRRWAPLGGDERKEGN